MDRIMRALSVAFEQHQGQRRKCNGSPYMVHILDVMKWLLFEPNISEDVVIAGILHDTLEDTVYTADQLERDFGSNVRQLVESVTEPLKSQTTDREQKQLTWRQRKQYKLDIAKNATEEQLQVSIADKVANLQSMRDDLLLFGPSMWDHFNASKEEIEWYHHSMWMIFRERLNDSRLLVLYEDLMHSVFARKGVV